MNLYRALNPVRSANMLDLTGQIIAYECGQLNDSETIELFAHLIKSGLAWRLQGHYGRTAQAFISYGYIDAEGNIATLSE